MTSNMIKIVIASLVMQIGLLGGVHYMHVTYPSTVLLIVDTSNAIKPVKDDIVQWVRQYQLSEQYKEIHIATDKAYLGKLEDIKGPETIFRVTFGRLNLESINAKYLSQNKYDQTLLLTNQQISDDRMETIEF